MNKLPEPHQTLKLFLLLIGSKAPGRNVEQHDFFFGIARELKELVPAIKAFWPEAGSTLHIDAWREVTKVEDYKIAIGLKDEKRELQNKLFFINLGGYQANKLEEQHYTILTVQPTRALAISKAKKTTFFTTNTLKEATSHIDDKYGIDVDDVYQVEDILIPEHKSKYSVIISKGEEVEEDKIHPGYLKLTSMK
ncbi:DUF1543 domain-containing protein [Hanamia caeni]|jgi:hypothetical protein|uniref:DUF1543 domain-containing protein n=1 Tax=Hanamia caeni TaxID=2294116 RepID=A0A3M9N6W7_9BACT|nr:DUF1543 domain-containing protein [Hanamia caeni]RNI33532.1 DUF1543 domain-containing protein [Hanamia caeni]